MVWSRKENEVKRDKYNIDDIRGYNAKSTVGLY